jgi:hypothetical protein
MPLVIARCVLPPSSLPLVSIDSGLVQDASPCNNVQSESNKE